MFELAVLIGVWLALCLALGAGFIVEVLAGNGGQPAVPVLRIQGLAVMFTFVAVACAFPLLSLTLQRDLLVANGLGLVAALVLSLLLIPPMGAEGAAVATVGAEAMLALVTASALMRARPGIRLPLGVIPVAAVAAAGGVVVAQLVGQHSFVEAVAGGCTYLVVISLLGRFPPELGHFMHGLHSSRSAQRCPRHERHPPFPLNAWRPARAAYRSKRSYRRSRSGGVARARLRGARGRLRKIPNSCRRTSEDVAAWHRADLLDPAAARTLVEQVRPTHLLHLAWYAEHGLFWTSTENVRWVEASLRLLRAFGEAGGERAVTAGTCAEYDWSAGGLYVEGASPLAPATLYGTCKHALRLVGEAWCEQNGIEFAWGRVFLLFGPGEHPERLVPAVAQAVAGGTAGAMLTRTSAARLPVQRGCRRCVCGAARLGRAWRGQYRVR